MNESGVKELWKNFNSNKNVRWSEVWVLVVLEQWLQKNID
jgi:hypothetical protein